MIRRSYKAITRLTKERKEKLCKSEVPVTGTTQCSHDHLLVRELVGKEAIFDEQYHRVVGDNGHQHE